MNIASEMIRLIVGDVVWTRKGIGEVVHRGNQVHWYNVMIGGDRCIFYRTEMVKLNGLKQLKMRHNLWRLK